MSEYVYETDDHEGHWLTSEEIVRCKDCKHYDPHLTEGGVCFLPDHADDFARWEVEPDGFCKWGEHK